MKAIPWLALVTVAPTVLNVTGMDSGSHPSMSNVAMIATVGALAVRNNA